MREHTTSRLVSMYANASSVTSAPFTVLNSGLITLGGEDDVNCVAGSYSYYSLSNVVVPYPFYMRVGLNVSSFNTSDDFSTSTISHPAWLYAGAASNGYVSQQVFDVFVTASGGLNYTKTGYYSGEHDGKECSDVLGSAQDVWMNLAGGGSIVFTPYDYLQQVGWCVGFSHRSVNYITYPITPSEELRWSVRAVVHPLLQRD